MQPSTNNRRPIITHENPKSPISEAYRTLRTNIQFSAIDEELRVIMVTSAGPGEGKSTTLTNLAVAYAQTDMKVVVIDADLRKPTMHHTFSVTNRWGLTSILAGQAKLGDVVQHTYVDNLSLITSGPIPPNPSEMLASKRMTALLDELKGIYDIILIDAPPTLAVTDSQIVATKCDGVILVVDSGKVKRDMAIKAKANLDHVKARILGVVLNNMDRKNAESYYYYYYGTTESPK
ncbi:capsular exopolysaccharide family [Paenibacillus sp. UNCCL117]|uniref:CpsD/CapB family tyrosine-protein kinase n=1 Tax=unclassified Paenibacillus TaxID=185978 RepID=UPI00088CBBEA|nr:MULTISPECIES: CpsD/CapB family tyrosine-protein kinase [unclassified Paenibacillus]SDC04040.1 capsular exopolysaccharide family [Paenibacillus sp. cl123]SFW37236.1 capsular exopolysaccharide family [Paenibacillus sp. UNCCL117]